MPSDRSKSSRISLKKNGNGARPDEAFPLVLLVEDDPRDLAAMDALLKRHGFRVVTAKTFDEAERQIGGVRFAAVVADYRLGSGSHDGFELLRRARDAQPRAARILVTSDPHGAVLAEACEAVWVNKAEDAAIKLPAAIRAALKSLVSGI